MNAIDYEALRGFLPEEGEKIARLQKLQAMGASKPKVIAFGKYNHGKSSLLNALAGGEVFKVADVRETTKIASVERRGMILIDTPGLGADSHGRDDGHAMRAARQEADILLIAHNVNTGEFDAAELALVTTIQKEIVGTGRQAFIVLTRIDEADEKTLDAVAARIARQAPGFQILPVSAQDFQQGRRENQPEFIRCSRIEALTSALDDAARRVAARRGEEMKRLKAFLSARLDKDRLADQERLDALEKARLGARAAFMAEYATLESRFIAKFQGV